MPLVYGCLAPHPPLLVPEVGRESRDKVKVTLDGMRQMADRLAEHRPDVLVFVSPHTAGPPDAVGVQMQTNLAGSFAEFGAAEVTRRAHNDRDLAEEIAALGPDFGIHVRRGGGEGDGSIDWGVLVPLHFLDRKGELPIVSFSVYPGTHLAHYRLGQAISCAAERSERRVALVASGDLSHRLFPGAPAGYSPEGIVFDEAVTQLFREGRLGTSLALPEDLGQEAGECGMRPVSVLAGAFSRGHTSRTISYEGPFGVGYLVAEVLPGAGVGAADPAWVPPAIADGPAFPLAVARATVEEFVRIGNISGPTRGSENDWHEDRAGVFVCIKQEEGLRGCMGTVRPVNHSIAEEIVHNALQAATCDPRFAPVREEELEGLSYTVDVLGFPEPVADQSFLDIRRYGVIVSALGRKGLLLPNLDGVESVDEQVRIASMKAGLPDNAPVQLERFEVTRYQE